MELYKNNLLQYDTHEHLSKRKLHGRRHYRNNYGGCGEPQSANNYGGCGETQSANNYGGNHEHFGNGNKNLGVKNNLDNCHTETKGNEVQPYNAHGNNYGSCTDSLNSLTGNPLPESYYFN